MKTILLKFAGPLQSWGTSSHFETRQTDRYPSKSAVIGMIAASLGFHRDADAEIGLLNDLHFAVRVDQPGKLLKDYHTAVMNKPDGSFKRTYVTNRYYIQDAVFVVAVGHGDDILMERIEGALKRPWFQPYMGRRSLPLPADFLIEVTDKEVIDSLRSLPWQAAAWFRKKHQTQRPRLDIYADADLIASPLQTVRRDRVLSFSQKERKLKFRTEAHIEVLLPEEGAKEDHDAFSAIGG